MYLYSKHTDAQLVYLLREGDEEAFNTLFERYKNKVFQYLTSITKSPQVAEEIVTDIFVKIWIGRELFKNTENIEGFILTVAKNKALDFLRVTSRQHRLMKMYKELYFSEVERAADELLIDREMLEIWLQAINMLPPQRKRIFLLNKESGMSYDEIARELNLSKNTVKNSLIAAKHSITDFLRRHPNGRAALCLMLLFV